MSRKFYICDGCEFVGLEGGVVSSLQQAKRFAFNDGQSFLQKQLKISPNWSLQRIFSTGKKYVVTTATKFVSNDVPTTKEFAQAKAFRSVADATAYIRNNKQLIKYIPEPIIVDDEFNEICTPDVRKFTIDQLKTLGFSGNKADPRRKIPRETLNQVYSESVGICALCGKPMTPWNRTIDHIIPKSKGGNDRKDNLRYVHKNCNQLKGNMEDKVLMSVVSDVSAKHIYEYPQSEDAMRMSRAFLRGIIDQYKAAGYFAAKEE